MRTIACCLVVGLGLVLDVMCGWLVVIYTYSYHYFPLSLYHTLYCAFIVLELVA